MQKTELQIGNIQLNEKEIALGKTELESYPDHLFTELTRSCNLRCFMCPRTAAGLPSRGPDMDWALFRRVASELFPTAVLVELNGLGESPLMGRWPAVMQTVRGYNLHPLIVSNGQEMNLDTIDFFVEREGVLRFSVDSVRPDLYRRLRGGASFQKLRDSLSLVRRRVRVLGNSEFSLEFVTVLSTENVAELNDIVHFAAEFGVKTIHMQHLVSLSAPMARKSLVGAPDEANRALWKSRLLAMQLDVGMAVPDFFPSPGVEGLRRWFDSSSGIRSRADAIILEHRSSLPSHCIAPWTTAYIEHDGAMKPCCVSETKLGNLRESDFSTIWNGENYQSLRAQILGNVPLTDPSCKGCYAMQSNRGEALLKFVHED